MTKKSIIFKVFVYSAAGNMIGWGIKLMKYGFKLAKETNGGAK